MRVWLSLVVVLASSLAFGKVVGALTQDQIDRVVRSRAGAFRACYQRELNHNPTREGKVVINFKIDERGVVQKGRVVSSTLDSPTVDQCLVSNVMRLTFPAASAPTVVDYPFFFKRG